MKVLRRYKLLIAVIGILLTAAFLRLYRIADYMTFLGDEGRDVLVVKGILEGNLVFLGPRASSGDFFLGPIYYYFMAPFLWLWRLDPVGPAVMIALLGIATVYLVYKIGKEFFGTIAGLIAGSLYAVSILVVQYSKSSWNPNAVPFFTILLMYFLYKAVKKQDWRFYGIVGILFGILMQLHYIIVFLGLIVALFMILGTFIPLPQKKDLGTRLLIFLRGVGAAFGGFLVGFAPFLAFEIKNGFPNFKTIFSFIGTNTVGGETSGASFSWIVSDVFIRLFGRLFVAFPSTHDQMLFDPTIITFWKVLIVLLAVFAIVELLRTKDKLFALLLGVWLILGILLFGFYKKPIYDYYFTFLFPVPFLLLGNAFSIVYNKKHVGMLAKAAVVVSVVLMIGINLYYSHLRTKPNRQLAQMQNIAEFALSKIEPEPYNFALIAGGNSDHAYKYFFARNNRNPVVIENELVDPERKTVTNQLLIICEDAPCSPLGHPLHEVASFGRAEIKGQWNLSVDSGRIYEVGKGEKPFIQVFLMEHYNEDEANSE